MTSIEKARDLIAKFKPLVDGIIIEEEFPGDWWWNEEEQLKNATKCAIACATEILNEYGIRNGDVYYWKEVLTHLQNK